MGRPIKSRSGSGSRKKPAAAEPKKTKAEQKSEVEQLFYASEGGFLARAKALLKEGADVNGRVSLDKQTSLHGAAESGKAGVARLLIESGADLDAPDYRSFTPLHRAAAAGQAKLVELLLSHGATPSARNTFKETPLHAIAGAMAGSTDVSVSDRVRVRIVNMLLDAGAKLEAVGNRNCTPLNLSAGGGDVALVRTLLARGANPNPKVSALADAREAGYEEIVALLLKAGAKR